MWIPDTLFIDVNTDMINISTTNTEIIYQHARVSTAPGGCGNGSNNSVIYQINETGVYGEIILYFAEIDKDNTRIGERILEIEIEGETTCGINIATYILYELIVVFGTCTLDIIIRSINGNALICGIHASLTADYFAHAVIEVGKWRIYILYVFKFALGFE